MGDEYAAAAEALANLVAITNLDPAQASELLANAGGNLELAVNDFFMGPAAAGSGGGGGGGGGEGGAGGDVAGDADMGGGDGDDDDDEYDGEEDEFDDEGMGLGAAVVGAYQQPQRSAPPPLKRAKVEMRQPPRAEALSADECKKLQQVFGLSSPVADGGDKLHRSVSDRQHSWAFGDDRSLTYLLSCFRKLLALDPAALAAPERDCFAKAVLLHHARTMLLSGEAHDDGLALEQCGQ